MNNPRDDLQTWLTAYFTVGSVSNITVIPNIIHGRPVDIVPESIISILNTTPVYDKWADYQKETYTLICEMYINLADSSTHATIDACVESIIDELNTDSHTWNKTGGSHTIDFYPRPQYEKDGWILPITFVLTYNTVAI